MSSAPTVEISSTTEVKKVIANMTVGKDVSALFADVVNCIQTDNVELKKLVYLHRVKMIKKAFS